MFPELVASDVVVTNSREVHAPIVAEHAIALVMALAKRLPSAIHHQQEHVWAQEAMWEERPRPREVAGATLGLIGLGSIGREVAQRALALGMCVLGSRRDPQKGAIPGVTLALLDEVVARADFLLLAAPLTESTRGLINVARLAAMRRDSFLINVSRGPLVDEAALCEALRKRQIAGAALDVFAAEPLASNSPLWDLPNLLITPHTAAVTDRLWERHYELISANLRRYLAGEPLLGVVDKRSGY
jgi:phosphoglycerate dehydrogenase-like enzyme